MGGGVGRAPLPDPSSPLSVVAPQVALLSIPSPVARVRVAAAAPCLLSPSLPARVLFLVPEQPPLPPLPRRPKPRVAPVVSLCHYALQSRYACRYTIALCARTLPVHRQVRHLPFPWSAPFHLVVSFNFRLVGSASPRRLASASAAAAVFFCLCVRRCLPPHSVLARLPPVSSPASRPPRRGASTTEP